ncbi:MAG: phosphopyruvate hydratase [archaeon YNP-LCB-003-016]|uniref:phosphopyruvate hydratase n=1 Tax=Candidatus Culexarchaeum yellowstonense TaxID=2928963 RepID=UPI0026ED50C4|nr:phosphopyruvate hydratase [Candidatus Culexarchaeum yellowstonense]MCR6692427.1 phosphopyruvate hydratase [Candidatus Culexarchaeum yellowstonense]
MERFKIREVKAREVLDCRGEPTIEVEVITETGIVGRASVPSGRSRGMHEAFELRDGGKRYHGKGVLKAVRNVNEILAPALKGMDVTKQREIDELMIELDGTEDKSKIGANAIVGVSLAVAKTAANALEIPLYRYIGGVNAYILPVPVLNLIEGGKLAATDLDFQEHQVMPIGAKSFSEAIRMGLEVYYELGRILMEKHGKYSLNVGVEGGYTPPGMKDPREALELELKAIEELGYTNKFALSLDCAATHLYNRNTGKYTLMGKEITREELIDFYEDLVSAYPIQSLEDPLEEEDFEGFRELTKTLNVQIIGDDLFATNIKRLRKGIEMKAANAILLKVNQVGTLSEALDVAELAFRNGYGVQVSERSGQTEDTWLADLTVGINAGQIKTGVTRSERTAQYNQLLRIEEELGKRAKYAGKNFKQPF